MGPGLLAQCLHKTQSTQAREITKGAKAMLKAVPMQLRRNRRDYATCNCFFEIISSELDIIIIYYYY